MESVKPFLEEYIKERFDEGAPVEKVTKEQLQEALKAAKANAKAPAAQAYLKAIPLATDMYGDKGFVVQLLYVMNNLSGWKGEEARAAKAIINAYIKQNK